MAKIELGREYRTRGGGWAVVYRDDGEPLFPMIGALLGQNAAAWVPASWNTSGNAARPFANIGDIIFPRTVMVPVEVPEWAKSVYQDSDGLLFSGSVMSDRCWQPIDDWIAELEGDHRA